MSSKAWFKSAAPRLIRKFVGETSTGSASDANSVVAAQNACNNTWKRKRRSIEIWTTTCIVTNFGRMQEARRVDLGRQKGGQQQRQQRQKQRQRGYKRSEESSSFLAKHLKTGRRLNVITLTNPKDIRKWRKVNYGRGLFGGGSSVDGDNDGSNHESNAKADSESNNRGGTAPGDYNRNSSSKLTAWFRNNPPTGRCGGGGGSSSVDVSRSVCDDTVEVACGSDAALAEGEARVTLPSAELGPDDNDGKTKDGAAATCGVGDGK
mmetsp:Transcript_4296/g.9676  ORF Transcript_4296/g.9676 Transcript_4296/m.9676 type:complete len:264 (+) Transcript_4296:158-949(+)